MPIMKMSDAVKKKKELSEEEKKRQQEGDKFIQEREKFISKAGEGGMSSVEARRAFAEQKRQEGDLISQNKALGKPMAAQSGAMVSLQQSQEALAQQQWEKDKLAFRQQEELRNIEALRTQGGEPMTQSQRLVAAGQATIGSAVQGLGLGQASTPTGEVNLPGPLGNASELALKTLGAVAGTRIFGVSLSSLFDTAGNVSELRNDISDNVAEAKRISIAAESDGADIPEAIKSLNILEESVRNKSNSATKSLRTSPGDIKDGLDMADEMSRNLRTIAELRQNLERKYLAAQMMGLQ